MSIKVVASNLVHQIPVKQADSGGGGGGGGGSVTVDSELSLSSENPVQNKVITEALNGLDKIFIVGSTSSYDETNQATVFTLNKTFNEIKSEIQSGKIGFVSMVDDSYYDYGIITELQSGGSSKIYVVNMGMQPRVPLSTGDGNARVAQSLEFSATSGTDYPICRIY